MAIYHHNKASVGFLRSLERSVSSHARPALQAVLHSVHVDATAPQSQERLYRSYAGVVVSAAVLTCAVGCDETSTVAVAECTALHLNHMT